MAVKKFSIIVFLFFFLFLYAEPACRQAGAETLSYIDAFDQADTNRDGYVSENEAEETGLITPDAFQEADSDMDGLLSLREAKGANLRLPKIKEEEAQIAAPEEPEPEEEAAVPEEIKKEQEKLEKLGRITAPTPALHRNGTGPSRSIQGQRRPLPRGTSMGAPTTRPGQRGTRTRRPPSFSGRRIPKPPASTAPNTGQPQPPQ